MRGPAKHLTKGVAIYGAGDAILQVVNFGLLWVYVHYDLMKLNDYGALGAIGTFEAFIKVITRWGLDGAFMRFYAHRDAGRPRQLLASTIFWFMAVANLTVLTILLLASGSLASHYNIEPNHLLAFRLMLVNIVVMSFTFFPFHVMRMENASVTYSAFTFARALGAVIWRVVFIIGFKLAVTGMYLADLAMTAILVPLLWRWFAPLVVRAFSRDELRAVLRFGLPRLPHGIAQQWIESAPKLALNKSAGEAVAGVYQNGTTLGTGVRFFTSAFETAWAPFYYSTATQPDAKAVFRKMVTYGLAVLVLLAAGTASVAREAVLLMLDPKYLAAIPVVPTIAVALALQGVYLLTSIGLNLTKRTELYPVSTISAALVGFVVGLWAIPTYGIAGAAGTVLVSYFTQTTLAFALSQRVYPIPYEWGRIARIVIAGLIATVVAMRVIPDLPPLAGLFARGGTTVAVYVGLLALTGFFRSTELAFAREMIARRFRAKTLRGQEDQ